MSERVNHTFWDAGKNGAASTAKSCETLQDTVMVVEAVDMCTGSVVTLNTIRYSETCCDYG